MTAPCPPPDCLADRAAHVPAFLRGLLAALASAATHNDADGYTGVEQAAEADVEKALHATRPADVTAAEWQGLFEFVVWKLSLLLGAEHVFAFCHDLLDDGRFSQLTMRE